MANEHVHVSKLSGVLVNECTIDTCKMLGIVLLINAEQILNRRKRNRPLLNVIMKCWAGGSVSLWLGMSSLQVVITLDFHQLLISSLQSFRRSGLSVDPSPIASVLLFQSFPAVDASDLEIHF